MEQTAEHAGSLLGLLKWSWVLLPILFLVFYKWTFRLFGIVIVPEDKIGLVTKKFVLFGKNKELAPGRIIATNGEAGMQAQTLPPGGPYWGYWPWQYEVQYKDFTVVPQGKIGLIMAKDGKELPVGQILSRRVDSDSFQDAAAFLANGGQKGKQVNYLPSGTYRINTLLFDVFTTDPVSIDDDQVGIVTTLDGKPLEPGHIAGDVLKGNNHNSFQNFEKFLEEGGSKGLQQQVILAGSYYLNPWAVQIEKVNMTVVPIGQVGVVISYVGEEGKDVTGDNFKHGNLVTKGQKGVWNEPLGPGKYPLNPHVTKVELVPTTNLVLNWATARSESYNLDKNLSTITVRSKDGFPFNLDVSQIIHIPMTEAPKVIARFGSMQNLVSQVLEPTIGNYFRNSAQDSDVIAFLSKRKERQDDAKDKISSVLNEYNVHAVDTLIGDINPPESLMKTLTERKIADEQVATYNAQMTAQKTRQTLKKEEALADMQKDLVTADQSVIIADKTAQASVKKSEGLAKSVEIEATANAKATELNAQADATRINLTGNAEANKILAIGKSTAEAYKLQVESMGQDNFTKLKVIETIGRDKVNVMPKVLITGGNGDSSNGAMNALLGFKLLESTGESFSDAPKTGEKVVQVPVEKKDQTTPKKSN